MCLFICKKKMGGGDKAKPITWRHVHACAQISSRPAAKPPAGREGSSVLHFLAQRLNFSSLRAHSTFLRTHVTEPAPNLEVTESLLQVPKLFCPLDCGA